MTNQSSGTGSYLIVPFHPKSGVIGVMTVGIVVTSRAALTSPASNTSSPAKMAAACPMTLSVMGTMTVGTSLMNWSTCASHHHPPALLDSSDVTMDTVSLWARCATGVMTALTTATRRDVVSATLMKEFFRIVQEFLSRIRSFPFFSSLSVCLQLSFSNWCMLSLGKISKK